MDDDTLSLTLANKFLIERQQNLIAAQERLIAKLKAEIVAHQQYKESADKLLEFYKQHCESLKAQMDENTIQVERARSLAADAYDRLTYHDFYAAASAGQLNRYIHARCS